jgi:hypothetical protein
MDFEKCWKCPIDNVRASNKIMLLSAGNLLPILTMLRGLQNFDYNFSALIFHRGFDIVLVVQSGSRSELFVGFSLLFVWCSL